MAEEIPANLRDQQKRDLEIHVEARNLGPLATQKKVARAFHSEPMQFDLELAIDSDEDPEAIATAIHVAHASCYTEQALTRPVVINYTHRVNGKPFEMPSR